MDRGTIVTGDRSFLGRNDKLSVAHAERLLAALPPPEADSAYEAREEVLLL
jgi:hypothetical protein